MSGTPHGEAMKHLESFEPASECGTSGTNTLGGSVRTYLRGLCIVDGFSSIGGQGEIMVVSTGTC